MHLALDCTHKEVRLLGYLTSGTESDLKLSLQQPEPHPGVSSIITQHVVLFLPLALSELLITRHSSTFVIGMKLYGA